MSAYSQASLSSHGSSHGLSHDLAALAGRLHQTIARYRVYRRTYRELSSLSDRTLADLGLNRSMLRGVARSAAETAR